MSEKAKGSQIDISGSPLPTVLNTMQQDIDTKASSSYVDTELAKKSDTEYVNSQLLLKADSSAVALALATKADASALVGLASEAYVDNAVSTKADASALVGLASETYVDNAVSTKADSTSVANALATKADASAVSSALGGKADASALSALDSAVVKKAELKQTTGGSEDTPMSQKAVTQAIAAGVGEDIVREAPEDGKQYARKDGAWEEVASGGGDVEEAPEDGKQYARKDGAWEEVVASGGGGESTYITVSAGFFEDLTGENPLDNLTYSDFAMFADLPFGNYSLATEFSPLVTGAVPMQLNIMDASPIDPSLAGCILLTFISSNALSNYYLAYFAVCIKPTTSEIIEGVTPEEWEGGSAPISDVIVSFNDRTSEITSGVSFKSTNSSKISLGENICGGIQVTFQVDASTAYEVSVFGKIKYKGTSGTTEEYFTFYVPYQSHDSSSTSLTWTGCTLTDALEVYGGR